MPKHVLSRTTRINVMAKQYTYRDEKTGKIIFETVEPNYVSMDTVDLKVKKVVGRDPRLDPFIVRQIRMMPDNS